MYVSFSKIFWELGPFETDIFFDIGRKAAHGIRAMNRMATLVHSEHDTGKAEMRDAIFKYKEESDRVCFGR